MTENSKRDEAILRNNHYEVNPDKMKNVRQQRMSDEDIKRIAQMRTDYLEWVHYNFAKKVLKAAENNRSAKNH